MTERRAITPELFESFLGFETEHQLFSHSVKGHPFWDYVRYYVMERILNSQPDHVRRKTVRYRDTAADLISSLGYMASIPSRGKGPYDLIFFDLPRTSLLNGKCVNVLTFPIVEHLHSKFRILVINPSEMYEAVEKDYPVDVIRSRPYRYLDKAKSLWTHYSRADLAVFDGIRLKVKAQFGADIDMVAAARRLYSFQLQEHRRYLRLFGCHSPKAVIYPDNGHRKPAIEAARALKIPTIELQHSLLPSMSVYCNYQECPAYPRTAIADYLFTYGDYWNNRLRAPVRPISVGYPFLELKVKYSAHLDRPQEKKNIIIAAGSYSKEEFVRVALQLADLLPDYNILYKLKPAHSRSWETRFPQELLDKPNVKILDDNTWSIYDYLPICAYQIGTNSSALYEGLYFGLTTFVLKTGWYEEMKPLYDGGYAFLVSSAEEIGDKIRRHMKPPNHIEKESLFKSNSLENMERAITDIVTHRVPMNHE